MGEELLVQSLLSLKHVEMMSIFWVVKLIEQQGNKSMKVYQWNQARRS